MTNGSEIRNPSDDISVQDLLNTFPAGAFIVDQEGTILRINHQAAALMSFNHEDLVGRPLAAVLPQGAADIMQQVGSGRQAAGMVIPDLDSCFLQLSPMAGFKGCYLIIIFDRRLWPQFFSASGAADPRMPVLTKFFDASVDGITIVNKNGDIVLVNKAQAANVGASKNEIQGRHVSCLVQKSLRSDVISLEAMQKRRSVTKFVTNFKSGIRVLSTATPIFGSDGEIEMVVVNERDLSVLDKLESDFREKKEISEKINEYLITMDEREQRQREMVAESPSMAAVMGTAARLAYHGVSHVLITGETGTGKTLLAKYFHQHSQRADQPLVHVNCATIPESLVEAELFGYEKGAFTGAASGGKAGLFEVASGGTLFLDEIGELPTATQAKLLTILDTSEYRRIGGTKTKTANCTIITATNQNLEFLAQKRKFRPDLLFRLQAFSLQIPPLRSRPEDIVAIAQKTLNHYNVKYNQKKSLDSAAIGTLKAYHFPGNVRELINMIHQAVLLSDKKLIGSFIQTMLNQPLTGPGAAEPEEAPDAAAEAFAPSPDAPSADATVYESAKNEMEKKILIDAIANSQNTRAMALYLGISHPTVCRKLRKYNLVPPGSRRVKN
jgi:PAS domain S-box-containing protein